MDHLIDKKVKGPPLSPIFQFLKDKTILLSEVKTPGTSPVDSGKKESGL